MVDADLEAQMAKKLPEDEFRAWKAQRVAEERAAAQAAEAKAAEDEKAARLARKLSSNKGSTLLAKRAVAAREAEEEAERKRLAHAEKERRENEEAEARARAEEKAAQRAKKDKEARSAAAKAKKEADEKAKRERVAAEKRERAAKESAEREAEAEQRRLAMEVGFGRMVAVTVAIPPQANNGRAARKKYAVPAGAAEASGKDEDDTWTLSEAEAAGGAEIDPKYLNAIGGKVEPPKPKPADAIAQPGFHNIIALTSGDEYKSKKTPSKDELTGKRDDLSEEQQKERAKDAYGLLRKGSAKQLSKQWEEPDKLKPIHDNEDDGDGKPGKGDAAAAGAAAGAPAPDKGGSPVRKGSARKLSAQWEEATGGDPSRFKDPEPEPEPVEKPKPKKKKKKKSSQKAAAEGDAKPAVFFENTEGAAAAAGSGSGDGAAAAEQPAAAAAVAASVDDGGAADAAQPEADAAASEGGKKKKGGGGCCMIS